MVGRYRCTGMVPLARLRVASKRAGHMAKCVRRHTGTPLLAKGEDRGALLHARHSSVIERHRGPLSPSALSSVILNERQRRSGTRQPQKH
eukprot:scaffold3759_cov425-Prasinococcus_capsulatus_cf.AAC.15